MKFYWKTAMRIHLCVICVRLLSCCKGSTEQSQQRPCGLQSLRYLFPSPFQKCIQSPWVICTHFENKGIEAAEILNVAHSRTDRDLTYCV